MKHTKKFLVMLLVLVMACSLFMTGCGSNNAESDPTTLVIAIADEIEGTDVQQVSWTNVVHDLVYEPLVKYNDDLSDMVPSFAEDYEVSEDGLTITFTLPEGAKFSNGDPCDAEAVKASFERYLEVSPYAGDLEAVESIEAVDDVTVVFHMSTPAPFMYASITSSYCGIVNTAVADEMGNEEFHKAAVGNGMYYVEDWQAGSQIVLAKNPYYASNDPNVTNKGEGAFEKIVIRFIPDDFTRVTELETGNVDIAWNIPSENIADMEANEDINTYMYQQSGVTLLFLNTTDPALEDYNVRKAINIGIDRDTLVSVLNDTVTPAYGMLSAAQAGFSADKEAELADTYKYDLEAAKQLLKDAGYEDTDGDGYVEKDGETLSIEYLVANDFPTSSATAPVIQEQMKALGIEVTITEYESAYIKQLQKENDYQMGSRRYVWNDADILYYVFTENSGYPWSDPEVTAALTDARYVVDTEERVEAYEEFHDEYFKELPGVPLFADNYCIASSVAVQGLVVTQDGRAIFNDVTK